MRIDEFRAFSILDYLKTEEDIAGYLQAVIENGDPVLIKQSLLDIEQSMAAL